MTMIGHFSCITHGSAVSITVKIVEFIIIYVFCLFPCFWGILWRKLQN